MARGLKLKNRFPGNFHYGALRLNRARDPPLFWPSQLVVNNISLLDNRTIEALNI